MCNEHNRRPTSITQCKHSSIGGSAVLVRKLWKISKVCIQDKSLSPSGVSKTKLNIYISSLHLYFVLFCFDCALLPKEKQKSRERKRKNRQDVLTLLFAFSLLLSSQLMLSGCVCGFFFTLVTFYLYLICCWC